MDDKGELFFEARCTEVSLRDFTKILFSWGSAFVCVNGINDDPSKFMCVILKEEDRPEWMAPEKCVLWDALPLVESFHQVSAVLQTEEEAKKTVKPIRKHYGEWLTPLQGGQCIDIVPVGINKATGIYRVMEHFGASFPDMIAVGDNLNDVDMIREFHSYAMENGVDEIKEIADAVVTDVTQIMERE